MNVRRAAGFLALVASLQFGPAWGAHGGDWDAVTPEVIILGSPPEASEPYAGEGACAGCHPLVYSFWKSTSHAASLETLRRSRKAEDAACLRCHTTGFGEGGGYRRTDPERHGAVGCESCHGPSSRHAAEPRIPTSGALLPDPSPCSVNAVCRRCHTPRHSPDFTPASAFDKIRCPPPTGNE